MMPVRIALRSLRPCLLLLPALFLSARAGGSEAGVPSGAREDLSGFFAIGMAINVLMIVLFLIWAIGQWRKKK